jgi:acyl carrier protein
MGLDTVELVIEVEKAFGIKIPDEEASQMINVGHLYHYLLAILPAQETHRCLSAAAFYRFRRALIAQFGVDRHSIRISTVMEDLIPEDQRITQWQRLGQRLNWQFPPLVCPPWMTFAMVVFLLGTVAVVMMTWIRAAGFAVSVVPFVLVGSFVGAIVVAHVTLELSKPFATRFPSKCDNVRGVIQSALALNHGNISAECAGWNRLEVWESLRAIIVEQLGVRPEEVTERAEFVRDFGAD